MGYSNNPKYWDKQAWANSADPDQMLQNVVSDQDLHFLPLTLYYFRHISGSKLDFQILGQVW